MHHRSLGPEPADVQGTLRNPRGEGICGEPVLHAAVCPEGSNEGEACEEPKRHAEEAERLLYSFLLWQQQHQEESKGGWLTEGLAGGWWMTMGGWVMMKKCGVEGKCLMRCQ